MDERTVITIGREFGSGGHEIGMKLAEKLGIKCYDKELLELAAKESGLCEELFASQDEKPTNSFLYSLVMDTYSLGYTNSYVDMPINHKVFLAQFDAIKKLAERESCVIVGRCADYILKDNPDVISVFCYSDVEERIQWSIDEYRVPAKQAKKIVQEKDAQRSRFYEFYTNQKWGNPVQKKQYNYLLHFMMQKKASSHLRMPLKINMKKIISIKKVGNPTFSFT